MSKRYVVKCGDDYVLPDGDVDTERCVFASKRKAKAAKEEHALSEGGVCVEQTRVLALKPKAPKYHPLAFFWVVIDTEDWCKGDPVVYAYSEESARAIAEIMRVGGADVDVRQCDRNGKVK